MTKVLIAAIIVAGIVITVLTIALIYRPRRSVDPKARALCDQAAALFGRLATPMSIDDMDILRPDSVAAIKRWMDNYSTVTKKEIRNR